MKIVINKIVHLEEPAGMRVVKEERQGGGEGSESYTYVFVVLSLI